MKDLPSDKIISCFYDSSEDCVKVVNTDGMLMSFNPNGLKVMEIDDKKDVIGKDWLTFWQGNMQQKAADALKKAQTGTLARFEGYCPTFKGNMRYWEVTIAPLHENNGDILWLLVASRDMTHQKELELTVNRQREKINALEVQLGLASLPSAQTA